MLRLLLTILLPFFVILDFSVFFPLDIIMFITVSRNCYANILFAEHLVRVGSASLGRPSACFLVCLFLILQKQNSSSCRRYVESRYSSEQQHVHKHDAHQVPYLVVWSPPPISFCTVRPMIHIFINVNKCCCSYGYFLKWWYPQNTPK